MSIDPMDPRPPYRQIADDLRSDIYSREMLPGARIPSERELVGRYGTAHQTVRQAITLLKAEGLLVGRPGRGVFVRERPPLVHRLDATRRFVTQAKAQGRNGRVELLSVDSSPPPVEVAAHLNLTEDENAVVRRYLLVLDDEPVQLADSYFPARLVEDSPIRESVDISPGQIDADLKARHGIEPTRFGDELSVRMPTATETRSLRLLPGTPVINLLRTYYDFTNVPFEVAHYVLAGDKHILVYQGRPAWLPSAGSA